MKTIHYLLRFIIFLVIFHPIITHADTDIEIIPLCLYSGINFNKDAGDYYGVQIFIVPYYGGEMAVWSVGDGRLQKPMLIPVQRGGKTVTLLVPNGTDEAGKWTFYPQKSGIYAVGPRTLKFHLRKRC